MRKRYFHEIPRDELMAIIEGGVTWREINRKFKAPDWCGYPDAIEPLGCWSLIDWTEKYGPPLREQISPEYCKDCDCNKEYHLARAQLPFDMWPFWISWRP